MIRKLLFLLLVFLVGTYVVLQLILGSRPIQTRIASEIRSLIQSIGYDLEIQSIDFSIVIPKIYFNGVKLSSSAGALIQIQDPIVFEKIRLRFEPLELLQSRIAISEVVFFHPKIYLPEAALFVAKIESIVKSRKQLQLEGGKYPISIRTVGIVDANVDVRSHDPQFSLKSNSITAFLTISGKETQELKLETNYVDIVRKGVALKFSKVALDLDWSLSSMRVNNAEIIGSGIKISARGTSSLPVRLTGEGAGINISGEGSIPLALLGKFPELGLLKLDGRLDVKGSLAWGGKSRTGKGTIGLDGVAIEGYHIGTGSAGYELSSRDLILSMVTLAYGGGQVTTDSLSLLLDGNYPLKGRFKVAGLKLDGLLDAIRTPGVPVRMVSAGVVDVTGQLTGPFSLRAVVEGQFDEFRVFDPGPSKIGDIVVVGGGAVGGVMDFSHERMRFESQVSALGGRIGASGMVNFDGTSKVHVDGKTLSLTSLNNIAGLKFAGTADLWADIEVSPSDTKIVGTFGTVNGEIADLYLGTVKSGAFFQNGLLSFENMALTTSLQPVIASGFVDFKPPLTRYEFKVDAKRVETDRVFKVFEKVGLPFRVPSDGEIGGKLKIEGGHDALGIEVSSDGTAKNFKWYDETWINGSYSVKYRTDHIELPKVLLVKNSGALEVSGAFENKTSRLGFKSHGLRIEELSWLGGAPFAGELHGVLNFEGDLRRPSGDGKINLPNLSYRGRALGDIGLLMTTGPTGIILDAMGLGTSVKLRAERKSDNDWALDVQLKDADLSLALAACLKKNIASIDSIGTTLDANLQGDLWQWKSMQGSAMLHSLEAVFRGSRMVLQKPVSVKFGKREVSVPDFELKGPEAELKGAISYDQGGLVRGRLDGKLDLQFVQPFVPYLDSGTGRLAVGIRVDGPAKNYTVLGNITLEDGTLRVHGLLDEWRSVRAQLGVSHESLNIERVEAVVGGGAVQVSGDVQINRFSAFRPALTLKANQVTLRLTENLSTKMSGQFRLVGAGAPYDLSGKCNILEARLTSLVASKEPPVSGDAAFRFAIDCQAPGKLLVATDIVNSEFRGDLSVRGTTNRLGMLGAVESTSGTLLFRETKFNISNASVRFESESSILPRFNIQSRALVKEAASFAAQEYEVLLQVLGASSDYKIRLSSTPRLSEPEIISLLVLGVTNRVQEGNYAELGSAIAGQIPVPSKIQDEFGVDIKLDTKTEKVSGASNAVSSDITVPSVRVEKTLSPKTKLTYSNTLTGSPTREFRVEQMLDDNLTANFSTTNKAGSTSEQPLIQSYGVDLRYRFQFE